MVGKIVGFGLIFGYFKVIKNCDGEDGFRNIFFVKIEG